MPASPYAQVGQLMRRATGTVKSLTRWVRRELRQGASPAELARRVRKHPSGLARVAWSHRTDVLLPGLAACRRAARLTQAELASRSGIARATISHLERLQRPARAGTARALAAAIGAAESVGRRVAYFFGVLAGAVADAYVKAGLPLPRGWELAADDEGDERKPVRRARSAAVATGA